jgi:hypothetical protein
VFHINGHWNGCHWDAKDSAPVVLSATDYAEFAREEEYTAVLKHMAMTYSLLFIGFGDGLADPTWTRLMDWARASLPKSPRWHYRLVRTADEAKYVGYSGSLLFFLAGYESS